MYQKTDSAKIIIIITLLAISFFVLITTIDLCGFSPATPNIKNRSKFHIEKGEKYLDDGEFQKAIKEFNLAYVYSITRQDKEIALREKINSLLVMDSCKAVLKTIEHYETSGFHSQEVLFVKAECLSRLGHNLEAVDILNSLVESENDIRNKVFFELREGLIFLSIDSLSLAKKTFACMLRNLDKMKVGEEQVKETLFEFARYSLGYINLRMKNYKEAEENFRFLKERFEDSDVGYKSTLYLALIFAEEGKIEEAISLLDSLDVKDSTETEVMKGFIFYNNGEFKKAKDELKKSQKDTTLPVELEKIVLLLSAECNYTLRNYASAVNSYNAYNKMVKTAGEKKISLYGLAWSYFKLGKYSDAYAVLKDFLVLYPQSPFLPKIERLLGLSLFYVGAHREAKFYFTKLLNLNIKLKDRDRIYYLRGKSEFYLKEYDNATIDFKRIVKYYPYSRWKLRALSMLARVDFEQEKYHDAYNRYKELLSKELPPTLLDNVRFQIERCLLYLGYYRNPIEMSRSFVKKYPDSPKSPDLQLEIAEFYFQTQKYWEAIREYERFLGLFPGDKNYRFVLYKLARSYSTIGFYEKALKIYRELVEGNDQFAESSLISMGDMLFSQKRYKESIKAFKELTKRFPQSNMADYANFLIGKNYLELNLSKEARVSFELVVKSKRIFPLKEKAKLLIAKTFYLEGKGEKYEAYLNNIIKTGSNKVKAEAYFLKAEYKKEIGRPGEAIDLFDKASNIYKEKQNKIRALYEAGLVCEELKLFDKAQDFYKKAKEILPIESSRFNLDGRIKKIESMNQKKLIDKNSNQP
ncbi:MAG: hypothetical protein B5M53_04120 [Candidatus Cloacimonas sp. 4484_209]|nr:MAG: hypothetical protein B5M53_04120 [Candidatus Cloacimonas sp. 4484_209]